MQRFRFRAEVLEAQDERLQAALAAAYADHFRPACDCLSGGVPMYIAHVGDDYVVKRMPNSGSHHSADCPSYEPPPELSGLGEVFGSAIQEDVETGITTLKLDFSLAKTAGRAPNEPSGVPADSVRTDGAKLTLRGTLHLLWDRAMLNQWHPGMGGKRNWYVVRERLLTASRDMETKGDEFDNVLFIPEQFSLDRKDEIYKRRMQRLSPLLAPARGARPLRILIAEVKGAEPARYGFRYVIKHLPDMPMLADKTLHQRLQKRFATELALWEADESSHMVIVATFGMDAAGNACLEEASLTLMTDNWIPVEHQWDLQLVHALTHGQREFTKCLRYNLAHDRPLACAVLTDTPAPVALYAVPADAANAYTQSLEELCDSSELPSWQWRSGETTMPELPARATAALRRDRTYEAPATTDARESA